MGLWLNMREENCGLRAAVEVVEELGLVCQSDVGRLLVEPVSSVIMELWVFSAVVPRAANI